MKKDLKDKNNLKTKTRSKILVLGLMLVVVIGILSPMVKIYAETIVQQQNYVGTNGQQVAAPAQQQGAAGATPATPQPNDKTCDFWNGYTVKGCFNLLLIEIGYFIMSIMSLLLGLAGIILDYILKFTVVKFSENIAPMTGINIAWKLARDLMNMAFIFILIYEAMKLIIGLGSIDKIKKFVGMVVLASILINFSLFFTKVIIDASNIVTVGFYNKITTSPSPNTNNDDLSEVLMSRLGLAKTFDSEGFKKGVEGNSSMNIIIITIGASIVFFVTAFIFLAISVMFLIRYLVLIVLLMLSPLGFMGLALPFMQPYASKWWDSLKGQCMWAPIYMIMTWIIIILISNQGFTGITQSNVVQSSGSSLAMVGVKPQDNVGLLINFAIIIGLLIVSLTTAKSTAEKGVKQISAATKWATGVAGGAIMGTTAWAGRRTVGAGASRLAESQRFQNWAGDSFIGEKALQATRKTASSSFDVRATSASQKLASSTGADFGKAQQGGYDKTLADKTAKREKFAQSLRGNTAKEAYATRKASGIFTRGGSNSSANTLGGIMGRSNRVVASKLLNDQLAPLESKETELQNRESQLAQQAANLANEISTLTTSGANPARLLALQASAYQPAPAGSPPGTKGAANRNSLAYVQDQLTTTQTRLTNTSAEVTRIKKVIDDNGLVNTDGAPVPGVATPGQIRRQNQLNAQLAMVNRAIATGGGTPTPAQQARLTAINTQLAGLQAAMNATIAATAITGNPALGVKNPQTGVIRGRRADEQQY